MDAAECGIEPVAQQPDFVLKKYPILNMFDCSTSGPTQAHFANYTDIKGGLRPGSILGTKRMHKTQGFRVQNKQFSNGEGFPFNVQGGDLMKSALWSSSSTEEYGPIRLVRTSSSKSRVS